MHPEHSEVEPEDDVPEITDVSVTKAPFEFVVTSTTPVKVSSAPEESREVKVVVYSVQPEHAELEMVETVAESAEKGEVNVVKEPSDWVVTRIWAVSAGAPRILAGKVVIYEVQPEQPMELAVAPEVALDPKREVDPRPEPEIELKPEEISLGTLLDPNPDEP